VTAKSEAPYIPRPLDQGLIDSIVKAEKALPKVSEIDPNRPGAWVAPESLSNNPNFAQGKKIWRYRRYAWGVYHDDLFVPYVQQKEDLQRAGIPIPDPNGPGAIMPRREIVIAYARCYLTRREFRSYFDMRRRWRKAADDADAHPRGPGFVYNQLGDDLGVKDYRAITEMCGKYNRYFQLKYAPDAPSLWAFGHAWNAMSDGVLPDPGKEDIFLANVWGRSPGCFQ
jgi:hypothetical protein